MALNLKSTKCRLVKFKFQKFITLTFFLIFFQSCSYFKSDFNYKIYNKPQISLSKDNQINDLIYLNNNCNFDICNDVITSIKLNNKDIKFTENKLEAKYVIDISFQNKSNIDAELLHDIKEYLLMSDASHSVYFDSNNAPHLLGEQDIFNFTKNKPSKGFYQSFMSSNAIRYATIVTAGTIIGTSFIPGFNMTFALITGIGGGILTYTLYDLVFAEEGLVVVFNVNIYEKQDTKLNITEKMVKRVSENISIMSERNKNSDYQEKYSKIVILGSNIKILKNNIMTEMYDTVYKAILEVIPK